MGTVGTIGTECVLAVCANALFSMHEKIRRFGYVFWDSPYLFGLCWARTHLHLQRSKLDIESVE